MNIETRQVRSYSVKSNFPRVLEGMPIVFNQPANMGEYSEQIAPDALNGIDLSDVVLLANHDMSMIPLARSPKTLELTVRENGLFMKATLPDTEQANAVYEAVKRGDLSKMSFAFDVAETTWNEESKMLTINKISRVYEVSVVNYAAYDSTSVEARSAHNNNKIASDEMQKSGDSMFNPITAGLESGAVANDSHSTKEYRSAFFKSMLGQSMTDAETTAFNAAQSEKRSDAFNTLSTSAAVVPTNTLNEVVRQARDINGLFNEIRLFNVPANMSVPVGTPTDAAAWHTEGAAVDRKSVTTTSVDFKAYELIKLISMSAAVKRMDISAFEKFVTDELRSSIADAIGAAIVNGNGTGKPTGILSGITWDANNSKTVTAITADDLLSMIAMIKAGYTGGAKFAMSSATLFGTVYKLKNSDGDYILTDAVNGGGRRIFGFDIVIDDNIPAGTVLFGNFKYYGVNLPSGIAIETSRESGFASGLIDFRALCIADGKPIVKGAFVKLSVSASDDE